MIPEAKTGTYNETEISEIVRAFINKSVQAERKRIIKLIEVGFHGADEGNGLIAAKIIELINDTSPTIS